MILFQCILTSSLLTVIKSNREIMFAGFSSVCDLNISCNINLYGCEMLDYQTNCKVFYVVHSYIESTERL